MRRRTVLFLTVAGLAAMGAGAVPWTVVDAGAARQLSHSLSALAGVRLGAHGPVRLAVLPAPRIKIDDVRLISRGGVEIASARQFRGQLRFWPLLAGRFELDDVTLVEPRFHPPHPDAGAAAAWAGLMGTLDAIYQRASAGANLPRRLAIVAGSVDGAGWPAPVSAINLAAAWPSASAAISLSGSAAFAGETMEIRLSGLSPHATASGGVSAITARIASPTLRAELRGALGDGARRLDGRLALSTTSLARLGGWLGLEHAPRPDVTGAELPASIEGACAVTARGVALSGASVRIGDNTLEGALALRPGEIAGWTLAGTLAADTLDLRQADLTSWWSRPPLLFTAGLKAWDLDLRISAAGLWLAPGLRAADVAASILLRQGRLEAILGSATALGGIVKARLNGAPTGAGLDLKTQVSVDRIDAAQLNVLQQGPLRLSGAISGTAMLESSGATRGALLRNLQGEGQLEASDGVLGGIDLQALLRRRGAAALALRPRGRTAFATLHARWSLAPGGLASIRTLDLTASGGSPAVSLQGSLGHYGEALALDGKIAPASGPATDIQVSGSWSDPIVVLSPDASEAGKPQTPAGKTLPGKTPAGSSPADARGNSE